jgi:hypothetical protein
MAARQAACNGCWTMKRALVVALLAGLAVGPVLYLVDPDLCDRLPSLQVGGCKAQQGFGRIPESYQSGR